MIQLASAEEMRGRVMALWSVAMIGSTPIGGPIVRLRRRALWCQVGVSLSWGGAILTAAYAISLIKTKIDAGPSSPKSAAFFGPKSGLTSDLSGCTLPALVRPWPEFLLKG